MDPALLQGALQGGLGIFQQAASGKTAGLGQNIGQTAGGLLGTAFGGPLGSALGTAVGGLAGGGLQSLIGGAMGGGARRGPKARARKAAARAPKGSARAQKAALVQAAASAPAARAAHVVAARTGLAPAVAAAKMATAAQLISTARTARANVSDALGASMARAPGGYEALAKLAGLTAAVAKQRGVTPGMLVRHIGLERLGQAAGVGGAHGIVQATGLPSKLIHATGLTVGAAEHAGYQQAVPAAVRRIVARSRPSRRVVAMLSGLEDEEPEPVPRNPPPKKTPAAEGPVPKPAGKTPGAVPVVSGNWDLDAGQYTLGWGDTLTGLAITYLGGGGRWREIWNAQDSAYRQTHNPDKLMVGERLRMPPQAVDNARKLLAHPGSKVEPNGKVTDPKGQPVSGSTGTIPAWAWIGGGVAALGLLAAVGLGGK